MVDSFDLVNETRIGGLYICPSSYLRQYALPMEYNPYRVNICWLFRAILRYYGRREICVGYR